jgi:hypothetical protein
MVLMWTGSLMTRVRCRWWRCGNSIPPSAVLFGADFVARSSQTAGGMLLVRASSAPKMPRRLCIEIYASQY